MWKPDPAHDTVAFAAWSLSSGASVTVLYRACRILFPEEARGFLVGHCIVCCWAVITICGFVLGSIRMLTPLPLLCSVPMVCVLIYGLLRVCISERGGNGSKYVHTQTAPRASTPSTTLLWQFIGTFWLSHVVVDGLLRFPSEWDDLMYHLPTVDGYLQAKSLIAPDSPRWSDPGNNEIIALWFVAPYSGDFLYCLTNLPATILLAWSGLEISRLTGVSPIIRHIGAIAIVTNYVVLRQLVTVSNDVAVAALFLATLVYAIRFAQLGRLGDLVFGAICLGLLAGVKYYALGYAAVSGATFILLILRRMGCSLTARAAVILALGLILFGGYWYLRNWIIGGSPFFPLFRPSIAEQIDGHYPSIWATTFVGNGRPEVLPLAMDAINSLCGSFHLMAAVTAPVTIIWLVIFGQVRGLRRRISAEHYAARLALAAATLGACAVIAVTPYAVEDSPGTLNQLQWKYCPVRYGLCFLSLSVLACCVALYDVSRLLQTAPATSVDRSISSTVAISRMGTGRALDMMSRLFGSAFPYLLGALLLIQCTQQLLVSDADIIDCLLIATNAMLLRFNFLLVAGLRRTCRLTLECFLWLSLAFCLAAGIGHLSRRWHAGFVLYYDRILGDGAIGYVTQGFPPGTVICVLDQLPYPFYGSSRQIRVCQPMVMRRTHSHWKEYLQSRQIQVIIVNIHLQPDWREWTSVGPWLHGDPYLYRRIMKDNWPYAVFLVDNGREGEERVLPIGTPPVRSLK